MSSRADDIKRELAAVATPTKATSSARFFKTGPGQYGEGDQFVGATVPEQRVVAKRYRDLPIDEAAKLLHSPVHEHRLTALMIWVYQWPKLDQDGRTAVHQAYLANTARINNWDLVDTSAGWLVGDYLWQESAERVPVGGYLLLTKLANSKLLWERRISIIATFRFIMAGEPAETLRIAEILIADSHDLIQKAVGWMLREVGKRCGRTTLEQFLATHYQTIPRTALRYAIEHFPAEQRARYLAGKV